MCGRIHGDRLRRVLRWATANTNGPNAGAPSFGSRESGKLDSAKFRFGESDSAVCTAIPPRSAGAAFGPRQVMMPVSNSASSSRRRPAAVTQLQVYLRPGLDDSDDYSAGPVPSESDWNPIRINEFCQAVVSSVRNIVG